MTLTTLPLSKPFGTVAYRDAGAGDVIVLIHGVGLQSAAWQPQIEALSASHRVIAVDLPGHGGSSGLSEDAQLPDYVEWLHAVVGALGPKTISLAGHSMGALIAAGFAVTYPEALKRVALLNGVYRRSDHARAAVIARAEQLRTSDLDVTTPLARWFGESATDQLVRAKVARWLGSVDLDGYATAYGAFARGDATYAGRLGDIRHPFLAITGDGDPNSTPGMARAMADAVPSGRAMVIKGHRHMVNLTAPDQVNDALKFWLAMEPEGVSI